MSKGEIQLKLNKVSTQRPTSVQYGFRVWRWVESGPSDDYKVPSPLNKL